MSVDYYKVLGIGRAASHEDVVQAYRKAVSKAHPDRGGDADEFRILTEAYKVLKHPKERMRYDMTRSVRKARCPLCFGSGFKWKQVTLRRREKVKCGRCGGEGELK